MQALFSFLTGAEKAKVSVFPLPAGSRFLLLGKMMPEPSGLPSENVSFFRGDI